MGVPTRARVQSRFRRAARRLLRAPGARLGLMSLVCLSALACIFRAGSSRVFQASRVVEAGDLNYVIGGHWRDSDVLSVEKSDRRMSDEVLRARDVWRDIMGPQTDVSSGLWEEVMHDVAVVIKTGTEVSGERLRLLRQDGWMSVGRRIPNLLVIGDKEVPGVVGMMQYGSGLLAREEKLESKATAASESATNMTTEEVDVEAIMEDSSLRDKPEKWFSSGGWRGDKDKNLPAFHLLASVYPGKKWYIMLDDDTYIFLDNFAAFLKRRTAELNMSNPFYTGKVFYVSNCGSWGHGGLNRDVPEGPRAGFAHGGSGIVLNGAAMSKLYGHIPTCMRKYSRCWAGDMQVALCLREKDVKPVKYNGGRSFERHFTPFSMSHAMGDSRYVKRLKSGSSPITFHKAPATEVALLSEFERQRRKQSLPVVYHALLKFLLEKRLRPSWPSKVTGLETHLLDIGHADFTPV